MLNQMEKMDQARDVLARLVPNLPRVLLTSGSGLAGALKTMRLEVEIPYSKIPFIAQTTVVGHQGALLVGELNGVRLACMRGRLHFYEGYTMEQVVFPFRLFAHAGVETFILTNAAGGMHPDMTPSDLVLVKDHINMMGTNPLVGPNDERLGERFPDMSTLYNPELRSIFLQAAKEENIPLREGVYVACHGPTYETPAEIRMYRQCGGDVVGMSTVPEAIALHHMKKKVAVISCVTNLASGVNPGVLTHAEVLETAKKVEVTLPRLIARGLKNAGYA